MDKEFKVLGKEDVLGRLRNIYGKMKKKVGKQDKQLLGKTKYIKCKGEFVKLSTYIKEHAKAVKDANKAGRMVKINKKISVINNVSKIKDKKIRDLLLKTFKKNAKIYFISDNKKWHGKGGGVFCKDDREEIQDFCRDSDKGVKRSIFNSVRVPERVPEREHDRGRVPDRGREHDRGIVRGRDPEPGRAPINDRSRDRDPGRERLSYESIDAISIQLSLKHNLEKVNNLYYSVKIKEGNKSFVIRPFIKYTENDKIIINFYFSIEEDTRWADWEKLKTYWDSLHIPKDRENIWGGRKWIELPIHVTLFFSVTKEGGNYISRHIHITSETDKLAIYGIKTQKLEIKGKKTHTYLLANNIEKLLKILKDKGKDIFGDWEYDSTIPERSFNYNCPFDNNWAFIHPKILDDSNIGIQKKLNDDDKELILKGIQSLDHIIYDIFSILTPGNAFSMDKNILTTATDLSEIYSKFMRKYGSSRENDNISFEVKTSKNENKIDILNITGDLIRKATISQDTRTSRSLGVTDSSRSPVRHMPASSHGHTF
jgi:predicted MPP superfamily phosphohydrolase